MAWAKRQLKLRCAVNSLLVFFRWSLLRSGGRIVKAISRSDLGDDTLFQPGGDGHGGVHDDTRADAAPVGG